MNPIHSFALDFERSLKKAIKPKALKARMIQAVTVELDRNFTFHCPTQEMAETMIENHIVSQFAGDLSRLLAVNPDWAEEMAADIIQELVEEFAHGLVTHIRTEVEAEEQRGRKKPEKAEAQKEG